MKFTKLQAHGNDFLVVELGANREPSDLSGIARRLCDRHFGAGADGVVFVEPATGPDVDWASRIFNADGGEAEVSGNGTRCLAAWLDASGAWPAPKPEVRIGTAAGVKFVRRSGRGRYEADMGVPRLASSEIPMNVEPRQERVVNHTLDVSGVPVVITAVSMGNPHCTVFLETLDRVDVASVGSALERHPAFPLRTNVEFASAIGRDRIRVRFWERGVGTTLSSGTGSCAAAVAAVLTGRCDREIEVETDAGTLGVVWGLADGIVRLTGHAQVLYSATWLAGLTAVE
jgi:diaminopimelate epimerase